jgi:hypothetical protein
LGYEGEAVQAFSSVLRACAGGREGEAPPPAGPELVARVNLARLVPSEVSPETAGRIAELLPAAFQEGETWWEMPKVLEVLGHFLQRECLDLRSPRVSHSLAILITLASQWRGTGARLREFTRLLPEKLIRPGTPPPPWSEGQDLPEFVEI